MATPLNAEIKKTCHRAMMSLLKFFLRKMTLGLSVSESGAGLRYNSAIAEFAADLGDVEQGQLTAVDFRLIELAISRYREGTARWVPLG